ncbi:MAG: ligase ATP-dependent (dnl1) [Acidobacteriaceae bacterium]|nr:ligase ATP-dependent (dnl1) [Acidobacteriaceae bacterium]
MRTFAETADRIAATTKKLEKTALLAEYLKSAPVEEAAVAAVFFSGRPFPAWEETTLQVGGTLLWRIVKELSGRSDLELTAAYREHGDLGAVAGAVLPGGTETQSALSKIRLIFREIAAARGPAAKAVLVRKLLSEVSPLEAKYIVKIVTGDLRIGLKESLVEEAIAKAFGGPVKDVQRANMLLGDIGETLRLAAEGRLAEARMRLFHPIGFMLASPAESAEDALSYFQNAWVEDKYDGIRAQAHCSGESVRFFSRTRDEITESFPELPDALAGLPQDVILDGEIVAWSYLADDQPTDNGRDETENLEAPALSEVEGASPVLLKKTTGRALPFSALQKRLGRKKVSEKLMREVPVAYLVFDVLYAGGELVMDRPLRERARILDELLKTRTINHEGREGTRRKTKANPAITQSNLAFDPECLPSTQIIRAPVYQASSPEPLNKSFDDAQARGNEGLMIKDPESPYTPGRRGKSWLKLKRELATLDVVVTAVEYGHGRRIGVLSDYTFAVRDGDRLLNIGKAYSGLTDVEIAEMTKWFLDHTIEDQGFRRTVEPRIVLEVAFNNIMKSDRHSSGYALRFPRIVRLRPDKLPEEADTMERVKEIFQKQSG